MPEDQDNQPLGQSISEIIDRTTAIVHEEIELAKAEIAISLQNLLRGSVAGIVGGVFAFFGLFILLIGLSFLIGDAIGAFYPWLGFLIVAFFLFLFGGLLAVFALKNIQKGGSQLTPSQAIDEAMQTKDALAKEVQEFEGDAVEEPAPGEPKLDDSDKSAKPDKTTEFSPPPAATHPAPDAVADAKEELKDARVDADAAGVDAKEAKRIAKREKKEAKAAAKAAAKAEQEAAKAEAVAAKAAEKAAKEAAKAAKKAEKNAAKAAVASGKQEPVQQPTPPQPPAPPQPPSSSPLPGVPQGPGSGQPQPPAPPPPPTGNQPPPTGSNEGK